MIISYFWNDDAYLPLAEIAIASAKLVMPDVPRFQITGPWNKVARNADEVVRLDRDYPFVWSRLLAFAKGHAYDKEVLNLDVDTVLLRPVEHVFANPFDLALTVREPLQKMNGIRYNWGVTFSRSCYFWTGAWEILKNMRDYENAKIERALCELTDKSGFSVHELDGALYNHVPEVHEKTWADDVHVLHYKNRQRKLDMLAKWSKLLPR